MDTPSLRELQQWVRSRIRPGGGAPGAEELLNLQRGVPGQARLEVYAEGYLARIREALAEVYEAVRHVAGERAFTALAEAYARQFPSHEYNLTMAGRFLPEFLPGYPLTASLPFLPDLASLEWQVCRAFHSFDEPSLPVARLAQIPAERWERVTLRFQPSVSLAASAWPIRDIWAARGTPRADVDIDITGRPQQILVYRRDERVMGELLDPREYRLLDGLVKGATLGAVCGELLSDEGAPPPVVDWCSRWAAAGLMASFEVALPAGIA